MYFAINGLEDVLYIRPTASTQVENHQTDQRLQSTTLSLQGLSRCLEQDFLILDQSLISNFYYLHLLISPLQQVIPKRPSISFKMPQFTTIAAAVGLFAAIAPIAQVDAAPRGLAARDAGLDNGAVGAK